MADLFARVGGSGRSHIMPAVTSLSATVANEALRLSQTASASTSGFDSSAYRQNTYGAPTHYCDCTRSLSSNGDGSLGDPWNLTQAMQNAVAGNVVGFPRVGSNTPVQMGAPNGVQTAAFNPSNDGTSGSRIVFVTEYAATSLDRATIGSNQNRTELRHAGTAAVATGQTETGTGGATYGSNNRDYITFDGFYVDMAQAEIKGDSGVIQPRDCTGVHFRNFVIKGTDTNCQSNAVIYRPHNAVGTILSNFRAYNFHNDPTGSDVPQAGLFSDQYGDRDFLIEHFDIDTIDLGIFLKGTAPAGVNFNWGTIQYGIVRNSSSPFRFNDLDATNRTYVKYCLAYNTIGDGVETAADGIVFDSISTAARNITIEYCTIAKVDASDINAEAALKAEDNGLGSGVIIRNNIFDVDSGSFVHMVKFLSQLPGEMNYNFYYKNGSTESYVYNGTQYNSFAAWVSAVQAVNAALETGSAEGSSSPFVNRATDDYRISGGHQAKTMSSTGGEIGCYATSETIGVLS